MFSLIQVECFVNNRAAVLASTLCLFNNTYVLIAWHSITIGIVGDGVRLLCSTELLNLQAKDSFIFYWLVLISISTSTLILWVRLIRSLGLPRGAHSGELLTRAKRTITHRSRSDVSTSGHP